MKDRSMYLDATNLPKIPIIFVMVIGAFIAILNQTLLNVALPVMIVDMNMSANQAQSLTTIFMLVNGILIPITAFLMEKFTTRQLFLTAMSLFSLGTLVCGLAFGYPSLLFGRIIQAAGAGIMMPLLMNVILSLFPVNKRGSAMGYIGLAMMFAPAIGPTLSGLVVQNYSWRILFFIVLPIAIIDIILAFFFLRNVTKQSNPKVNYVSILMSTVAFGGLLLGFSLAGEMGWKHVEVIAPLIIGAIVMVFFIRMQLKLKTPILEFRVFKYSMFSLTTVISVVITMSMFAAMILVPIYLQNLRGFSPLASGLMLLPGALISAIMSPITGKLFDRIGARPLAITGLGITAITTFLFSDLSNETGYYYLMFVYSLRMVGISMIMMPIMTAGLNQLPQRLYSHGTAMANTLRQMSGAIGTAFLVTVMSSQTVKHMDEMTQTVVSEEQLQVIENLATIEGINDSFMIATIFAILGFILSFFIKRRYPPEESEETVSTEQKRKRPFRSVASGTNSVGR
ncbi:MULTISPECIES: DHA2 family efflux MFS transporter permease subunit [Oceanobacillus]|uniref:Multidrug resistance protein n=1 Tax=Oceanobacillus kimchii TaxID=746691 RepID=A0ABQ5TF13_9BACI|nr:MULTISPECIES: DHA2 family efflux MFS transporter permease subunit [Oceanobacillus]MBT2599828.1 DHA2 family efflux MFS transporter permease subunit [Oceanobacillus sp. ISL-74]MBT2652722.1 DHA2 family efflux MFS transporter permease subunit [Oceanobacillus sp. ISL-73]GLO64286.1 multidrug resistance protein [Oceanobacillus kimchii]